MREPYQQLGVEARSFPKRKIGGFSLQLCTESKFTYRQDLTQKNRQPGAHVLDRSFCRKNGSCSSACVTFFVTPVSLNGRIPRYTRYCATLTELRRFETVEIFLSSLCTLVNMFVPVAARVTNLSIYPGLVTSGSGNVCSAVSIKRKANLEEQRGAASPRLLGVRRTLLASVFSGEGVPERERRRKDGGNEGISGSEGRHDWSSFNLSRDLGFSSEFLSFLDGVELPESFPSFSDMMQTPKGRAACEQCHGAGEISCPVCEGKGYYVLEMLGTVSAGQCGMCRGKKRCPCPTCKEHVYIAASERSTSARKSSDGSTDEPVSRHGFAQGSGPIAERRT